MDPLILAYTQRGTIHKADACTLAQENLLDEHHQRDGNLTFQFKETVDYRLPLSRLGIIQTSLASALAPPSVVGYHLRKQMAHVLAYAIQKISVTLSLVNIVKFFSFIVFIHYKVFQFVQGNT